MFETPPPGLISAARARPVERREMEKTNRLVVVRWYDAKVCVGAYDLEEALSKELDTFNTPGYWIDQNDKATIIAQEVTDRGRYQDIVLIPNGCIISIQELVTSPEVKG